jgi:phosphomannomutase/phosphoglucomutase
MNNNIFREYDIRGIADIDLDNETVYLIGKAFGTHLITNKHKSLSISGDVRKTTDRIKKSLIKGVLSQGVDVYDIGILPTPVNYFSLYNTDIVNSVQITGSHNPSEYNGLKISFNKKPFYGEDIKRLQNTIEKNKFITNATFGKLFHNNILDKYKQFMFENIKIDRRLNVVMDCGNAVGGIIAPEIYKNFNIELEELYCDVDPDFPNHHPDPTVDSNLKDMIDIVKSGVYDVGIAFDGDADRIVAVSNKGEIIRADILLAFFLEFVVKKNDTVVYDVKCSKSLEDSIKKLKAKPIMWKTGHSLIKSKMIDSKSKIGGEMSGHIFFSDKYFGFDDGIYVGLRLLEILSRSSLSLSDMISVIPKYFSTPEIRIDCKDDNEKNIVSIELINYFKNKYDCCEIDGVRINYPYGWGLIRSSNTQPVIVFRFEADTKSNLIKIKDEVLNKAKEYNLNIDSIE